MVHDVINLIIHIQTILSYIDGGTGQGSEKVERGPPNSTEREREVRLR